MVAGSAARRCPRLRGRMVEPSARRTSEGAAMQLGMVGLGRMGGNIVRRLMRDGHECVVYDVSADAVAGLVAEGAVGVGSLAELVGAARGAARDLADDPGRADREGRRRGLRAARARRHHHRRRQLELPRRRAARGGAEGAAASTTSMSARAAACSASSAGTASWWAVPTRRSSASSRSSGRSRPGSGEAGRTPGRTGDFAPEELGYLHCGPSGAGHFVKMVHNGIEYGVMAALAEGLNILEHADAGIAARPSTRPRSRRSRSRSSTSSRSTRRRSPSCGGADR